MSPLTISDAEDSILHGQVTVETWAKEFGARWFGPMNRQPVVQPEQQQPGDTLENPAGAVAPEETDGQAV